MGPGGVLGGYRALAFDSIAQGLFLLISLPFYKISIYMYSNEDPEGSLGALRGSWRVFGGFSGHGFNRKRGTWGFVGGSGSVTGVPGRPSGVPWPQAVLSDSRDVFVMEVQN